MKTADIKPDNYYTLRDGTLVRVDRIEAGLVYVWERDDQEAWPVRSHDVKAPHVAS